MALGSVRLRDWQSGDCQMRMRAGGWALALVAIVAIGMSAPARAACDDGTGCENTAKGIADGQQATAEAAAEAQAEPAEKPLALVTRKTSKPRTAQKATPRKAVAAKSA